MKLTKKIKANDGTTEVVINIEFKKPANWESSKAKMEFNYIVDNITAALMKEFHIAEIKFV